MSVLRLPLWFATERTPRAPETPIPCDDHGAVVVFTKTDGISSLLVESAANQWKIELITDRKELLVKIADLHERQVASLCLNPEPDGSGVDKLPLRELLNFCDSLVLAD